ncbi:MAG: hypothetical protein JWN61_823 [Pseudonocardiales bacterium]|nr:hypothetical protein [Pseudonocardiales bacterium]
MGRGAEEYADSSACLDAIADLRGLIGGLQIVLKPAPPLQWAWGLRQPTGQVFATSGYSYDRQLRCEQAALAFVRSAAEAPINSSVAFFGLRRRA